MNHEAMTFSLSEIKKRQDSLPIEHWKQANFDCAALIAEYERVVGQLQSLNTPTSPSPSTDMPPAPGSERQP